MFLDTNHNRLDTVLGTLYQNFLETAMKCYRYMKCMPRRKQPSSRLVEGKQNLPRIYLACCTRNRLGARQLSECPAAGVKRWADE